MYESGSYLPGENRDLEREVARLAAQVELSWDEELRILQRAGLAEARTIIDVGCGPGFVARKLLDAAPDALVTALEVRTDLAAIARRSLDRQPRARVIEASLFDDALPSSAFDFALLRFVLQHLPDPAAAIAAVMRLLRPGGTLAVIEVDAGLMAVSEPFVPQLAPIYARAERLQHQRGGSRTLGRRLWRLLNDAGCQDVRHEAFVYHSDALGLDAFAPQMDPARLIAARDAGLITDVEYGQVVARHEAFFASPDSFVLMMGFAGIGRKR